jgi:hypothetical protein
MKIKLSQCQKTNKKISIKSKNENTNIYAHQGYNQFVGKLMSYVI